MSIKILSTRQSQRRKLYSIESDNQNNKRFYLKKNKNTNPINIKLSSRSLFSERHLVNPLQHNHNHLHKQHNQNFIFFPNTKSQIQKQINQSQSRRKTAKKTNRKLYERLHTIQNQISQKQKEVKEIDILQKEKIIKSCISQLNGVLDILNKEKANRRILNKKNGKSLRLFTQREEICPKQSNDQTIDTKHFDDYILRIKNKKRQDNVHTLHLSKRPQLLSIQQTIQLSNKQGLRCCKTIEQCNEIECSSIDQVNQSSFLSEIDNNILGQIGTNQSSQKKISRCFNKVKANFPSDFF